MSIIHSIQWHGHTLRWGGVAGKNAIFAQPPVFITADPGEETLAQEVSWMAIDAFEALFAAYPHGPSVENVRDLWRNLLLGISRRVAEVHLVNLDEMDLNAPAGPPLLRVAGLVATCIDDSPTWIAFSSGELTIIGADGQEIPCRDDVGWDMPGYLWTIPMQDGQRFAIVSDALRRHVTQGRIRSVLTNLVRAERAAAGLVASARSHSTDVSALVVDVINLDIVRGLSSATTVVEEETNAYDEPTDNDTIGISANWGMQVLGISRTHDDGLIRRSHAAPPEITGFRFVSYLGSGGFSDVYLYEELLPRRMVAIKVLSKRAIGDASSSRFTDEVNTMAQLSGHPSVVTVHAAATTQAGLPYIVMQYCPLPSLSERIFTKKISLEEALRMGVQISGAVHTAHLLGIHHHDLKPGNVLYSAFGRPMLGDFGIATLSITSASDVMGASVPWAPPEVLAGEETGRRGDVYSLAATVFTAVTGKSPHGNKRREGELPNYEWIKHPELERVFRDAMESDPMLRTASAQDFGNQLREVQALLGYEPTLLEIPAV